jgi:integrase
MLMPAFIELAFPEITSGIKAGTREGYAAAASKLKKAFATTAVSDVDSADLFTIRTKCKKDGQNSPWNTTLCVLRLLYRWGIEQKITKAYPCGPLKNLPQPTRDRYITDDEYAAIYKAAPERIQVLMELCYRTAQRVGDVLEIHEGQLTAVGVDFRQGKTVSKNKGRLGKKLTIGWSPQLSAVVERAKAMRPYGGVVVPISGMRYIMQGRGGVPMTYEKLRRKWNAVCKVAGVADAKIHDLRAKAATDVFLKHGIKAAQALLGHATEAMTWRYIRARCPQLVEGPSDAVVANAA